MTPTKYAAEISREREREIHYFASTQPQEGQREPGSPSGVTRVIKCKMLLLYALSQCKILHTHILHAHTLSYYACVLSSKSVCARRSWSQRLLASWHGPPSRKLLIKEQRESGAHCRVNLRVWLWRCRRRSLGLKFKFLTERRCTLATRTRVRCKIPLIN